MRLSQLNVEEADKYITERTKAVIINNPTIRLVLYTIRKR